ARVDAILHDINSSGDRARDWIYRINPSHWLVVSPQRPKASRSGSVRRERTWLACWFRRRIETNFPNAYQFTMNRTHNKTPRWPGRHRQPNERRRYSIVIGALKRWVAAPE